VSQITIEEIQSRMIMRREQDSVLIQAMIANRDRYNAEIVTLVPDQSDVPATTQPGPNFFIEGVDGIARLANQDLPKIICPTLDPGEPKSALAAAVRQAAMYGAWHESQIQMKLGRAFRHYGGYGTFAMVVMPDDERQVASIEIRDPLTAYPELRAPDDIRSPRNVGFMYARSAEWIKAHYPGKADAYLTTGNLNKGWETLWDVVEWIDEDVIVIGLLGPRFPAFGYYDSRPIGYTAVELDRFPNKAGMVPVVVPRRVTLDKIMGQMTNMINYSDIYGRLLTLQLSATEKSIYPDMVLESRTGGTPQLVGGVWKDGRTGDVNTLIDGTVQVIGKEAGPGTVPMLQLIDQHIRGSGGASALMGGNAGGMRTGAGVDALGDYGPNPMAAEAQMAMAYALTEINKATVAVQKGYYPKKKFLVALGVPGSSKAVSYSPAKDLDSDMNVVVYPHPGIDQNRYAVVVSQLNATKMISRRTARKMNPLVGDEEEEEQFTSEEEINDAILGSVAQLITSGQMPISVGARIAEKIGEGIAPAKAVLEAQAEAATAAPAPGSPGGPEPVGPPGSPTAGQQIPPGMAAMLAASGAGPTAAPGQGIPAAPPGLMNLRHVLQGENENISPGAV
jgi:hypothetical protein